MSNKNNQNNFTSDAEQLLKNYKSRIAKEGWIKSLLCGLTVGFCLDLICAVIFLFLGIKLFWIGIIAFAVGTAVATPLFYYKKFQKSTRQIAARVDALGLEERILTMTQLEGDDSFMARRQREDAVSALKTVNESLLKLAVSVPLIVACAVTCMLGVGATTASALSNQSIVDKIDDNNNKKNEKYYDAIYGVQNEDGGRVEGELNQSVISGGTTIPVEAIADDDYVFVGWSDGYMEPIRSDVITDKGLTVYAIFEPVTDPDDGDDEQDKNGDEGDERGDEGNPSDGGSQPSGDPSDGNDSDGNGAGGTSNPSNQVVDGSTYYGDMYNGSVSDAQDAMNSNTNMSGEQSDAIGDYFNGIAK